VVSSKIVVPTMFNIPVMEEMAKGLSVKAAEAVMRLYDPCIPCTTHVVRMR
jgi:coenzyme F420 hydrogenase subunit alpha